MVVSFPFQSWKVTQARCEFGWDAAAMVWGGISTSACQNPPLFVTVQMWIFLPDAKVMVTQIPCLLWILA